MMRDLWYKDAIVYCLDVETFLDSNHDGVGDFNGLTERLDYLAGLGINCLWLMPFYPSPNRDDGYDVLDYYSVDSRLGSGGDFVELMHQARERGMRVIVDLVVNHTSIQHPWFQSARSDKHSPYRDWYVWRKKPPKNHKEGVVFPGHQESVWSYDRAAKLYYFHRFYKHQPDLNTANPKVREEILKIMGYWIELGVSGFRIDAAPFLIEGEHDHGRDDPHDYFRDIRQFLSFRRGDAVFLAEANIPPEKFVDYFGDGDKMHLLFAFLLNQKLWLSLAREDATPLLEMLQEHKKIPASCQWAHFLRNHDELDLGRLSDEERNEVFAEFAPEEQMRIYDRGIRRRLASMFDDDRKRMEMAMTLMFALPGTPVIRYGDEIGMGEDLSMQERLGLRTPMQWRADKNAGFSEAPSTKLIRAPLKKGPHGYLKANVDAQRRDPDSLLNWMERLIRVRKECPELGRGEWRTVKLAPTVVAIRAEWNGGVVLALHNLSREPVDVTLDFKKEQLHEPHVLWGPDETIEKTRHKTRLEGYGYKWLRLRGLR